MPGQGIERTEGWEGLRGKDPMLGFHKDGSASPSQIFSPLGGKGRSGRQGSRLRRKGCPPSSLPGHWCSPADPSSPEHIRVHEWWSVGQRSACWDLGAVPRDVAHRQGTPRPRSQGLTPPAIPGSELPRETAGLAGDVQDAPGIPAGAGQWERAKNTIPTSMGLKGAGGNCKNSQRPTLEQFQHRNQ